MTQEEFYGSVYAALKNTEANLLDMVDYYTDENRQSGQVNPIVYCTSRIKSSESVLRKCRDQGFAQTAESALKNLYDLVGIRVICAFSADVYALAEWLKIQPNIQIVKEKDYYAYPKPNGYRSYHIQLKTIPEGTQAEIQLRTIATDFWATLEHQLKYKKEIPNEKMIRRELKLCADEIASVDLSMQTIRELIRESICGANRECVTI